jgi:hypothetical protein
VDGPSKAASYQNVTGIIGILLSEKQATLKELREMYSLKDAMIMYEAVMVPRVNQYWAQKDAERAAKNRNR